MNEKELLGVVCFRGVAYFGGGKACRPRFLSVQFLSMGRMVFITLKGPL